MGFTTPCFIRKNTPELRDKMKELGYVCMYGYKIQGIEIFTSVVGDYGVFFIPVSADIPEIQINMIENFDSLVDCGENEELFLAIAALRDDTDYMQWFTNGSNWYKNRICDREVEKYGAGAPIDYHKATVEELIEHFKK